MPVVVVRAAQPGAVRGRRRAGRRARGPDRLRDDRRRRAPARAVRPRRRHGRAGLLDATVTAGHAFGGDLEAVSVPSALALARHVADADVAIVAMGPGVVGTGTALGTTVGGGGRRSSTPPPRSGGRPVAALRVSERRRPRPPPGASATTRRTALDLTRRPVCLVAAPPRPPSSDARHDVAWSHRSPPVAALLLADAGLRVTTMGRGPARGPAFFAAGRRRRRASPPRCSGRGRLGSVAAMSAAQARAAAQPDRAAPRRPAPAHRRGDPRAAGGLPRRAGVLPPGLRARQGRAAGDGHPLRVSRRARPPARGRRLPHPARGVRAAATPGSTPTSWPRSHLAASAVRVEGLAGHRRALQARRPGRRTAPADLGVHVAPLPADPNLAALFGAVADRTPVALRATARGPHRRPLPARVPARPLVPRPATTTSATTSGTSGSTGSRARWRSPTGPASTRPPPPCPARPVAVAAGREEPVQARVRIDGRQARWAVQHVGPDHGRRASADGAVVVELPVTNRAAFRSFVLVVPRPRRGPRAARAARRDRRPGWRPRHEPPTTAGARLQRLLAMVPWIAAHDGPTVDEVVRSASASPRRSWPPTSTSIWLVGLPPYTPDALIDVVQEGDRVWIHFADVFDRAPAPHTRPGRGPGRRRRLGARPARRRRRRGAGPRAWPSWPTCSGSTPTQVLDVDLGGVERRGAGRPAPRRRRPPPGPDRLLHLRPRRPHRARRRPVPRARRGRRPGTCSAYCHLAGGERRFRVDRIDRADAPRRRPSSRPPRPAPAGVFQPDADDPRVVLRPGPGGPLGGRGLPGRGRRASSTTAAARHPRRRRRAWLERLLVSLGPTPRCVDAPDELARRRPPRRRADPGPLPLTGP